MQDQRKTKAQLIKELNKLRQHCADLERQPALTDLSALSTADHHRLSHQIESAQQRFSEFGAWLEAAPDPQQFVAEARHELSSALEELYVASEELRQQNDELVAARHQIELERQRYQDLFDFAPDGYLVTTADGVIREANRAAAALLNVPTEALVGKPLVVFVAEGDRVRFHSEIINLQCGVAPHTYELRLQPRARGSFAADLQVVISQAPNNQIATLLWLMQDKTDRQRAEERLRQSEQRYRLLADYADDVIWTATLTGQFTYVSPSVFHLRGFTPEEVLQQSLEQAICPGSLSVVQDSFRSAFATAQTGQRQPPQYVTIEQPRKDGTTVWTEATARVMHDETGRPIGLVGVSRDITARKQAEEALRLSELDLKEAQAVAHIGSWKWDIKKGEITWSDEMYRIFGIVRESYTGRLGDVISKVIHPDDLPVVLPSNARTFAEQQPVEYRIILPDKSIRHIWAKSGGVILDQHGTPIFLTGVAQDVTDRNQAETALHTAFRRFQLILSSLYGGILVVRDDGRVEFANQAFCDLFDLAESPDDLLGLVASDIIVRIQNVYAEPASALARIQDIVAQRQPVKGEEVAVRGERTYVRDFIPINIDGQPHGRLWNHIDITARKRAEDEVRRLNFDLEQRVIERTMELETVNEALHDDIRQRQRVEEMLRRSEQRYRTLFESAADAIIILTLDGQFIEANHVACERFGYSVDELRQRNIAEFNAPDQVELVPARLEQIRHKAMSHFETVHCTRAGLLIPVDVNSRVIEYSGQPAVLSIVRDVSERKQSEQALQRYSAEQAALYNTTLLLSAQLDMTVLLRLIVEQATGLLGVTAGGVYLYDDQRQVLTLAVGLDFYAEYLGIELKSGEGLSGRAFQQRAVLRLDDYQTWDGRAAAFQQDHRIHSAIAAPLLGQYAPLGVLFVVGDQRRPYFDAHDVQLVELLTAEAAIALENAQLNEQQQAQYRRLQDAQARLIQSEKMSALGRLIASISHEINNPLQAVQGCLTLVREGIDEAPGLDQATAANLRQDLAVADSEVKRIASIVQRLRDFYRPTRTGWQTADVLTTLDGVLALAAKQLQHSRIVLEQVNLTGPLTITTNVDQLKQIILNLVLNAIDAMPGGGRLRVTTALVTTIKPAMVRIDFTDSGQGIAPENLARIFEPFFTTKETGSGLGLSISYELLKALGGDISVTSQVGQGSTFTLRLPMSAADESEAPL